MADSQLNALTATTAPERDSNFYVELDPGGTPASRKVVLSNITPLGWIYDSYTWTYASATTFTIGADVTSIFKAGLLVRFSQSGTKYGIVASSSYSDPNTTVTLVANASYSVANAAITSPCFSFQTPPDFVPLNWVTSSWSNLTIGSATSTGLVYMKGKVCHVVGKVVLAADSSVGTAPTFTLPIAVNSVLTQYMPIGQAGYFDAAPAYAAGMVTVDTSATVAKLRTSTGAQVSATVPHTWATTDEIHFHLRYLV